MGVMNSTDCALTINSISQITISAGVVYVLNSSGVLIRTTPASTVFSAIPAASALNFRLDQVVVDSIGNVTYVQGSQSTAATLNNRTGASTSLPAESRLLYDVLVTSGGVLLANVRDRRPWARGFRFTTGVTSFSWGTTVPTLVPGTQFRAELTGVPLVATYRTFRENTNGVLDRTTLQFWVDGALASNLPNAIGGNGAYSYMHISASELIQVHHESEWTAPTVGSHLLEFRVLRNSSGNYLDQGVYVRYEEMIRQNSHNGTS